MELTERTRVFISSLGADLVGFADLSRFPKDRCSNMPYGISIAIAIDPVFARQVLKAPTMEYYNEYERLNAKLDQIALAVQHLLVDHGYAATAQTVSFVKKQRAAVDPDHESAKAPMPHKTVAALSGLGWIGKNTLLLTEQYGSAVRLTSVLTDAPLEVTDTTYNCRCGGCSICSASCPGGVIKNQEWTPDTDRDELIDFYACRKTVVERGKALGIEHASCGICMAVCPYTQKYLIANGS